MNKLFRLLTPVILIGAIVIFSFMGIKGIKNKKAFIQTTGVITSITVEHRGNDDTTHHVMVKYSIDGREYENELGTYSSGMKEGKEIDIIYNPENPDEIDEAGYMGIIMSFVMALISLFMLIVLIGRILTGRY